MARLEPAAADRRRGGQRAPSPGRPRAAGWAAPAAAPARGPRAGRARTRSRPSPPNPSRGFTTSSSTRSSIVARDAPGRAGRTCGTDRTQRLLAEVEADHVLDVGMGQLVVGGPGPEAVHARDPASPAAARAAPRRARSGDRRRLAACSGRCDGTPRSRRPRAVRPAAPARAPRRCSSCSGSDQRDLRAAARAASAPTRRCSRARRRAARPRPSRAPARRAARSMSSIRSRERRRPSPRRAGGDQRQRGSRRSGAPPSAYAAPEGVRRLSSSTSISPPARAHDVEAGDVGPRRARDGRAGRGSSSGSVESATVAPTPASMIRWSP